MKSIANFIILFSGLLLIASCASATAADSRDHKIDILETIINMPELEQYYHVGEMPGRAPLIIVCDEVSENAKLRKFGMPVVIYSKAQAQQLKLGPHLVIESMLVDAKSAKVAFNYMAEGVGAEVKLTYDQTWTVTQCRVWET